MTSDEMRELIVAALRADDRIVAAVPQDAPNSDAIGAEDVHGDTWWIIAEGLEH